MGFFKKLLSEAGDSIKKSVEERKQELLKNVEERKQEIRQNFEDRKKEALAKMGLISATKQTSEPEPHKIIQSGVISTHNNELKDFKRKKMDDLREARDEKDRNRTPDNINKWKQVMADIEAIDTALKAGATTFGELKELAKDNTSLIAEIDEFLIKPKTETVSTNNIESQPVNIKKKDVEVKDDAISELIKKMKEQLQSLGMSSFILYGSDYEGDKEYEEVEQLGNDGLLESSSEYAINYNDSYNGFSSVYTKVRKINIQDGNVLFDLEEIYEDNNGEYESKGYYADQSIDRILSICKKDTVESGFERILNYLSDETLIKLNKEIDSEVKPIPQAETKTESNSEPESKTEGGSGLFSARLEALINSALQDGVLTEQEKAILKKRAEAEGEDWDEVEMIINARLAERQPIPQVKNGVEEIVTDQNKKVRKSTSVQQANCSDDIQTTKDGLEKKLESQYLIINGTVYKEFSENKINGDLISKVLGRDCYSGYSDIVSITIPTCVKKIDKCAFEDFSHLEEITIPSSVTTIGENAFGSQPINRCLKKVFLNCPTISSYLFYGGQLEEVIMGDCVKIIDDFAFFECENLTSLTMPCNVIKLGCAAFSNCTNLQKVDFSKCNKLESIEDAFGNCENLTEIDLSNCISLKDCEAVFDCLPNIQTLVLPPGQQTFNKLFLLEQDGYNIDTSKCNNVKVVNGRAFSRMKIKEIVIPDSVEVIGKDNDGDGPFYECENLKTIVMPAALKEIIAPLGGYMEELKKIDFSKVRNLRTIPKKFVDRGCYKLKELIIPQGVTEIEDEAFGYIDNLKRLFLPPTLESIGDLGQTRVSVYCFSPSLEELEPLVYGYDDDDDDNDWDDDDLEDLDEEDREELKEEKKEMKINLYVLPQYLDKYIAQRKAERIPEDVLIIQEIPEEYRYYYDE